MTISKSALEAITKAPSAVDSFIATLDALVVDQTITADVAGIVKLALNHARKDLDPAIVANTHT